MDLLSRAFYFVLLLSCLLCPPFVSPLPPAAGLPFRILGVPRCAPGGARVQEALQRFPTKAAFSPAGRKVDTRTED